jgi:anti-sigma regulatory factor (Ser/Thr protein kinase)
MMPSHKIELAPAVSSCLAARRFVRSVLDDAPEDVRDRASLLTSEAVTNALVHATGPVTVEVRREAGSFRIEVSDCSSSPPIEREPTDGTGGRGLHILNHLAAAWGWQPSDSGKVVWIEMSATAEEPIRTSDDPYPAGMPIAMLQAPVEAMIRTGAHYDALYVEFRRILDRDPSTREAIPGRLLNLVDKLGVQFLGFGRGAEEAWEQAVSDGRAMVDVRFRMPAEAASFVEHYNQLLEEADDYCQREQCLGSLPFDEPMAVRRWAFGQVANQCRGEPPIPWSDSFLRKP